MPAMVQATQKNTGALAHLTLTDSGYASEANFAALQALQLPASVAFARVGGKVRKIDPDQHPACARMAQLY